MKNSKKKFSGNTDQFYFDEAAAGRAVDFFDHFLVHCKGELAGKPLTLETWQREIVQNLFGWKRTVDGTRRYKRAYIFIPRKNGKSTLASGIGLYLLYADKEPGAEVYSAAADRDQASIVFDVAKQMVLASPDLAERSEVLKRVIFIRETHSVYRVLSADAPTKHGLNPHGIIFDELHAQRDRELWDVLTTGTGARRQSLTVALTTAGFDRQSICYELHQYAEKVRDGVIVDDSFLPVIYGAGAEDDWKLPDTWAKANPNLGVSVKLDYLAEEAARAAASPAYENTFKRLHLNIWTEQEDRYIPIDAWDGCGKAMDIAAAMRGRDCIAGIDLSTTTDLSAVVLLFPVDGSFYVLPFFFMPKENMPRREKQDRVPFSTWVRGGYVTATEGNVVDYDFIRAKINELGKVYNIREIAIDRWNATQLSTQLMGDGFEVTLFGQGFASLSAPTKHLLGLILSGKLVHDNNPVLRWQAANVAAEQDAAGNVKPSKKKSTERIDGIAALLNALGRAMVATESSGSVYESRGFLEL